MILNEVKVNYTRQAGEDNPGKVRETYLVDGAVSFADAENCLLEEIKPFIFGDCEVQSCKRSQFFDIFPDGGDNWYEAKVEMIIIDGDREIRKPVTMLIQADTIDGALKELHYKHLTDYDCEIVSIKKSAIVDILRG